MGSRGADLLLVAWSWWGGVPTPVCRMRGKARRLVTFSALRRSAARTKSRYGLSDGSRSSARARAPGQPLRGADVAHGPAQAEEDLPRISPHHWKGPGS